MVNGARVVLCRILGGIRGWPGGFELLRARCIERGIVLLALGGEAEPDAEMTAASTAPAGAVAIDPEHGDRAAWTLQGRSDERAEGFATPSLHASYVHVHWARYPDVALRFTQAASYAHLSKVPR